MALIDVVLPEDQVEGTRSQVQRWLKAVGEHAKRDEPLVEIETDKVTVEVPSPADGVLAEIVAAEGVDVSPGAVIARLRTGAAAEPPSPGPARATPPVAVAARSPSPPAHAAAAGRLSPAVKRLLLERGLRAEDVAGSGEGGRLTVDDVLAAAPPAGVSTKPAVAEPVDTDEAGLRRVPHTPMRRRIAAHMVESLLRDRAARHERVAGGSHRRARRSRAAQGGVRTPGCCAHADRLLRRSLRGCDPRRAGSERALGRRRDPRARSNAHRRRNRARRSWPGRACDPRRGQSRSRWHRRCARRARRPRARGQAHAGGPARRDLHDFEPRRERQPAGGADHHQPAPVGDPRRRQAREACRRRDPRAAATRSSSGPAAT